MSFVIKGASCVCLFCMTESDIVPQVPEPRLMPNEPKSQDTLVVLNEVRESANRALVIVL